MADEYIPSEQLYVNNINNITNELLLKYDEKFNSLYKKILNINSSIMNKEELIIKEDDEIKRKEGTIIILIFLTIFVFLFGCVLISFGLKIIEFNKLIKYSILLFVIYIIVVCYYFYYTYTFQSAIDKIRTLDVSMKNYVKKEFEEDLDLVCPATCPPIKKPNAIVGYRTPTLNVDPQLNIWKYGDVPTDLYTSASNPAKDSYIDYRNIPNYNATILEEATNEPKPFFGSSYPQSTFYKCKWLGGESNGPDSKNPGLPNPEHEKYSSIPCDYRPNFKENGKFLCTKDPNKIHKDQFSEYCTDVSKIY